MLSYFGIFGIFFSLISNFISYFIKFNDFEYKDVFKGKRLRNFFECFPKTNLFCFFGSILFWFIENNLIWYCISSLSPNHYIIYRNISSTFIIMIKLILDGEKIHIIIISFVSLIGIFICGLIFNEIIIIRICQLEKYTIIELDKRQKEELEYNEIESGDENNKNVSTDSDMS